MREISLNGGEPPLRVYDTSGPSDIDVREGLPKLRREWILARGDCLELMHTSAGDGRVEMPSALLPHVNRAQQGQRVTQMHYARRGEVTAAMELAVSGM